MMGQSIGPVLGGILTQFFGFRAIFWTLFILGTLSLASIIFFLPETLRSIAGNGTIRLTGFQRPLIYKFKPQRDAILEPEDVPRRTVTFKSIVAPLKFLFEKDVIVTLLFGAIVYTVWSMVTSSTTTLFQTHFHLTDLQVGLAFLPNGAGCVAGSYLTGYLMDYDYNKTEIEYREAKGIAGDVILNKKTLTDFPIEKSRLRSIWWIIVLFVISTSLYGFSLNLNRIAVPLVLQFFIAYTATAVFSLNSALVVDLYPGAAASATAVNNLIRCSIGAVGVGVVQIIIDAVGAGITFAAFAVLTVGLSPLLVLEWVYGESWRRERTERLKKTEKKTEVANASHV
jgi:MFS family permease